MGVLPDAPIPAALAQLPEALRSERRGWGWNSLTRHHFAHVVQRRDGALKTRTVPVQSRPWALLAVCLTPACSPRQRRSAQDGKVAGASPATRTISGMSTGRASRTCLLNSGLSEWGVWCESTAFRHSFMRAQLKESRRPYTPHRTKSVPGSGALPDARTNLSL